MVEEPLGWRSADWKDYLDQDDQQWMEEERRHGLANNKQAELQVLRGEKDKRLLPGRRDPNILLASIYIEN